jgi:chromosome segregation ATPase
MWSEISTRREELLKERAEFDKIREELRRSNEQAAAMRDGLEKGQIASEQRQNRIEEQLERLANAVEKAAVSAPSGRDEQLVQAVEAARQQQANWQQDRASLEAELRAERQRTSQQSDALAEQRRTAAEQQAELAGELKRMRSLLEHLLNHMRQPASGAGDGKAMPASPENAALESMLAQFEMLQRDLAQRRAGERKDSAKTLRTSQT